MTKPHANHDEIADQGFSVIRNFLTPDEVSHYIAVSESVVQYARDGHWPDVRTRGKQFPPWPKNFSPDIWGVSGLLHPGLGEMSLPFQRLYSDDRILAVAADVLQTSTSNLTMELFNMLVNPLTDFDLAWHRDHIRPDATPEEESEQLLQDPFAGTQFNLALTDDKCLIVIPGSHKRVRTDEEREKTTDETCRRNIKGQIEVILHPGDIVFYNSNILHRGKYSSQQKRLTLHGSYGHKDFGKVRAKGVLQHGVATWLPELVPVTDNMKNLKRELEVIAHENEGTHLGYSLEG